MARFSAAPERTPNFDNPHPPKTQQHPTPTPTPFYFDHPPNPKTNGHDTWGLFCNLLLLGSFFSLVVLPDLVACNFFWRLGSSSSRFAPRTPGAPTHSPGRVQTSQPKWLNSTPLPRIQQTHSASSRLRVFLFLYGGGVILLVGEPMETTMVSLFFLLFFWGVPKTFWSGNQRDTSVSFVGTLFVGVCALGKSMETPPFSLVPLFDIQNNGHEIQWTLWWKSDSGGIKSSTKHS